MRHLETTEKNNYSEKYKSVSTNVLKEIKEDDYNFFETKKSKEMKINLNGYVLDSKILPKYNSIQNYNDRLFYVESMDLKRVEDFILPSTIFETEDDNESLEIDVIFNSFI